MGSSAPSDRPAAAPRRTRRRQRWFTLELIICSNGGTLRRPAGSQISVGIDHRRRAFMETIEIGGPDIVASRIALGTWAIGGWMWGGTDARDAIRTIHAALDRGVSLIDTAPAYGFGRAEEIVGEALAIGGRRERVLIATKVGLDWRDGSVFRNATPSRIRHEVEASLRR